MMTDRKLTLEEYRNLERCLRCGIKNKYTRCDDCIRYGKCDGCRIILRPMEHRSYTYSPVENGKFYRESYTIIAGVEMANKTTCVTCEGWRDRVKDRCWICDRSFNNYPRNYQLNGNACNWCVDKITKKAQTVYGDY